MEGLLCNLDITISFLKLMRRLAEKYIFLWNVKKELALTREGHKMLSLRS